MCGLIPWVGWVGMDSHGTGRRRLSNPEAPPTIRKSTPTYVKHLGRLHPWTIRRDDPGRSSGSDISGADVGAYLTQALKGHPSGPRPLCRCHPRRCAWCGRHGRGMGNRTREEPASTYGIRCHCRSPHGHLPVDTLDGCGSNAAFLRGLQDTRPGRQHGPDGRVVVVGHLPGCPVACRLALTAI